MTKEQWGRLILTLLGLLLALGVIGWLLYTRFSLLAHCVLRESTYL